jgi:inorganic triphosphatase YgiF
MPTEVEAKFIAQDAGTLEALAAMPTLGRATLGPMRRVNEVDRYLDTADRRLAKRRWACRLRSRDGAWRVSLKGPQVAGGGGGALHERPEVEGPATDATDPGEWPRSGARTLLEDLSGGDALAEVLVLDQLRGERSASVDGQPLAVLSIDEVRIRRSVGSGGVADLRIVELEALPDASREAFDTLAAALAATAGLVPEPLTKLERALGLLDGGA